jgi:hypothetical protein
MSVNRERQRAIKEAVVQIRERMSETSTEDNPFAQCEDLAEILGLLIAFCRAQEVDEALAVEIVVRAIDTDREQLDQTAAILSKLGYRRVAPTLRRLGRRARPRPPSFEERMRLGFHQRIAAKAR